MKTARKIVLGLLLSPASGLAQTPTAPAVGPVINASLGYSYMNLAIPSSSRAGLHGADTSFTVDFFPRLGAKADLGYVRTSNVFGTGHHSDVFSYLAGPVFYPVRRKPLTAYVQALVGGAKVTGGVPGVPGGLTTGFVNKLSWGVGAGVDYQLSTSFAFRAGADYLHTSFFDSSLVIRGQHNIRTVSSFVYLFGERSKRRRGSTPF